MRVQPNNLFLDDQLKSLISAELHRQRHYITSLPDCILQRDTCYAVMFTVTTIAELTVEFPYKSYAFAV